MKTATKKLAILVIIILSLVFIFVGYSANLNQPSISISLDQDNEQVGYLEKAAIRLHLELCELGVLGGCEESHVGYLERLRIRMRLELCNNGVVGACQVICTSNLLQNCACFNPYWNKNVSCINGIDQDRRSCLGCCCNNAEINCTSPPSLTLSLSYGGAWGGAGSTIAASANDPDGTNVTITCSNPNFSCTNGCTNPLPEGTGTTACTAIDGDGESRNRTVGWQTDYTAPNISLSVAGQPDVTITILVGCSDTLSGCDGATYQISIDGGGWTSLGIYTLTGGSHTIQARGSDNAGNIGSTSITINLDNTPPIVSINKPQGCSGTLTITGTAADNVNIASITVNVDGTNNSVTPDGSGNWSYTQAFKEGNHTASVTATDSGGNSASASVSFGVDNTAPSVSLPSSWTSNEHGTLGVTGDVSKVKITLSTNTGETSSKTYSSNNYPTKIKLETYLPNFIFRETSVVTVKAIVVDSCENSDTALGKIRYYFPPSTATPLPTQTLTNTPTPSEKRSPKPTNTEKAKEIIPIYGFVNELGDTSITVDEKRYTLNANSYIDESLGELKSGVKVVGYAYNEGFIVIELQVMPEDGVFCGEIENITDSNENGEYFIMIDSLGYPITPETVINEIHGKMESGALVEGAVWDQEVIQVLVVRNCENLFGLFKGIVTRRTSENSNGSRNIRVEGVLYQLTPTTKIVSDNGGIQWGDKVEGIYLTIDGTVISVRVLERGFDWRKLIIVVLVFLMILLAFLVGIPFDGYLLEIQTQHIKVVKDEKEFEISFSDSQRKLIEELRGQDVKGRKVPIFNKLITIK
jgi:hypothetical protein